VAAREPAPEVPEPTPVETARAASEDDAEPLDESDFEEVDRTVIAGMHEIHGAFADSQAAAGLAQVERSIDQRLVNAEPEIEELGFSVGFSAANASSLAVGHVGEHVAEHVGGHVAPAELADDDEPAEEVEDFEILAEADAEDADLLVADGEADATGASGGHATYALVDEPELDPADEFADEYARIPAHAHRSATYPPIADEPAPRPSESDFVSRLELSDHFAPAPPGPDAVLDELDADSQFTHAGALPDDSFEFDTHHADPAVARVRHVRSETPPVGFPPLHAFDSSDVIEIPVTRGPAPSAPPPAVDSYDLENALEALDVDLDDLSITHAPTQLPGPTRTPRAPSIRPGGVRLDTDIPIDLDGIDDE